MEPLRISLHIAALNTHKSKEGPKIYLKTCSDSTRHNQDVKLWQSTVVALEDANPLIGLNSLHGKFLWRNIKLEAFIIESNLCDLWHKCSYERREGKKINQKTI